MNISAQKSFQGIFKIPGDKSVTHRAIMFNAAAEGEATVTNALLGEDCLSTIRCMRALGADIRLSENTVCIRGASEFQNADCDCGNSGTTIRLLMGLVSGKNVRVTLTGDGSLSSRPMERVAAPLRLLGPISERQTGKRPSRFTPLRLQAL